MTQTNKLTHAHSVDLKLIIQKLYITICTLKMSPYWSLNPVRERWIWSPTWSRFPTRGHGLGPGGGGYFVWSSWESRWKWKKDLLLFWPQITTRRRVKRQSATVTLDREPKEFSLIGRIPNSSGLMLQVEILRDKREKVESEETKNPKKTRFILEREKTDQILVKRKENVPHTVSCKNQTRKEY